MKNTKIFLTVSVVFNVFFVILLGAVLFTPLLDYAIIRGTIQYSIPRMCKMHQEKGLEEPVLCKMYEAEEAKNSELEENSTRGNEEKDYATIQATIQDTIPRMCALRKAQGLEESCLCKMYNSPNDSFCSAEVLSLVEKLDQSKTTVK